VRRGRLVPVAALFFLVGTLLSVGGPPTRALAFDVNKAPPIQRRLLDGFADIELNRASAPSPSAIGSYARSGEDGCRARPQGNVKVNQNCLNVADPDLQGRSQAQNETSIAADPLDPRHLVASFNDYRRGDGNCMGAYSLDAGRSWTDTLPPMGFTRGAAFGAARAYWQGGGDTSVAWDTKGNAYFSCQTFNRGLAASSSPDLSSAFYVFRSTASHGAAWNFPARPVAESPDVTGTGTAPFLDKQLMTVDNHQGSPFQDRVYVTWTTFEADGTAYLYEAYSTDFAETFSSPVLISTDSSLCGNTQHLPAPKGRCNENQDSQPFTGPDGALYVAYANFNNVQTGADNRNQILLVRSSDGGRTFGAPVKVTDFYDLPDCATYQNGADPGRACIPEKATTTYSIFRASNYPSGAASPADPSEIVVTIGSYINSTSNESNGCSPAGLTPSAINKYIGVKTPGACNNKILVSVSHDAGATFNGTSIDPRLMPVASGPTQSTSSQWFQWAAFTGDGRLAVSYYDRQYGDDETTGSSDVSLAGSADLQHFGVTRVTSSSMPPPSQFTGTFWGDYAGLAVASETAFPLWSDTRTPDLFLCPGTSTPGVPPALCTGTTATTGPQAGLLANDEDIFTAGVPIPQR
jgi:hypothetical protein